MIVHIRQLKYVWQLWWGVYGKTDLKTAIAIQFSATRSAGIKLSAVVIVSPGYKCYDLTGSNQGML